MAAAVLLDAALFRHLVSFQAGLPGRIHAYWQRHRNVPNDDQDDSDQEHGELETGAIVALAVRRGDVAMLRELRALALSAQYYRAMALLQFRGAVFLAARCGHVDVLAWLHGGETVGVDGLTCDADAGDGAACHGHASALRWLLTHCPAECARGIDVATARRVAQRGHLDVIQCLFELRAELFTVSPAVLTSAVESGRLDVVRFLHSQPSLVRPAGYCKRLLDKAAAAGQLPVVRYLHTACTAQASTEAMDVAAANGHLDVVQFLHENRREGCTVYAMDQAAAQGHLDVVRFLHENRREGCTVYAMGGASRRGHLEVLRFLHEHRREGCSSWALAEAAEKGHLEVVAFLHEHRHGVDWEDSALFRATRNGHLEVVEYLCEHTRVGDRVFDARRAAKTVGRDDIVRVLDVQIKKLLEERDLEQREKLRRRKHAKSKKKRK